MTFDDGEKVLETWDAREPNRTFVYRRPSALAQVILDPAGKLNLERNALDDGVGHRDGGPSLRAAARASFWMQTVAGIVGL